MITSWQKRGIKGFPLPSSKEVNLWQGPWLKWLFLCFSLAWANVPGLMLGASCILFDSILSPSSQIPAPHLRSLFSFWPHVWCMERRHALVVKGHFIVQWVLTCKDPGNLLSWAREHRGFPGRLQTYHASNLASGRDSSLWAESRVTQACTLLDIQGNVWSWPTIRIESAGSTESAKETGRSGAAKGQLTHKFKTLSVLPSEMEECFPPHGGCAEELRKFECGV